MIRGFNEETAPLDDYELHTLVPVVVSGLKHKHGKGMAAKNGYIVGRLQQQRYKISEARLRKVINYIRINDLVPCLIATSAGYYIAESEEELCEYEQSLKGREDAIRAVRYSISRQRKAKYNNDTQMNFNFR